MASLTIIHTNDLHNRLTPDKAARLSQVKAASGYALLFDAGDAVGSGNATFSPGGEPALDLMSDAGYDAMAVGNREFHVTQFGFRTKLARARFPVLSANIRPRGGASEPPCRPTAEWTIPGLGTVQAFGLTVPMVTERMPVRRLSAYVFDDPVLTARVIVPGLRASADLLVCISHCGLSEDRRLAEAVPGIDVIVGGHTHATLPEGEIVGSTRIVHAASHAQAYGQVVVRGARGARQTEARLFPL
jgi:2',3'-cyclic-nucleotide 2'-phosphodiesterase (5'-nucleotidase family)